MFSKKIGTERYVRCSKCGVVRNINETLKCSVCETVKTQNVVAERERWKKIKLKKGK